MTQFSQLETQINRLLAHADIVHHGQNLLARMQKLVDALGNPEKNLTIVHVAGTSGKTSTCYFVASLLNQAGYTTGLTISPHVDTVRERAIVNLQPLSEKAWVAYATEFFTLVKNSNIKPSYFEFYMAFAYWLFAKLKLDYAVIETGLGGTWDGSNIATNPDKICLITDIGYDHTEILGDTITAIASEKAGIIHAHNNVYVYPQSPEITSVIQNRAMHMHAKLHLVKNLNTNFMARNFNLAQHAVNFTLKHDHQSFLTKPQIKAARTINVPARAEPIIYQNKQIIMDGSHNPQKLTAFKQYLNQKYPSPSRTLLASLGSNKLATLDQSMQIFRQISDYIILTSFQNDSLETNKRTSIDQATLISAAHQANFKSIKYIHNPTAALKTALNTPAQQLVITGSFYLLDHLRPHLLGYAP